MNPSPNFFEDRPGAIWKQEGTGDVTYQSVDQKTIDGRTFNRMREYDVEITKNKKFFRYFITIFFLSTPNTPKPLSNVN